MKRLAKVFSLVLLTTMMFVLVGCSLFGPSMPRTRGKKVELTATEFLTKAMSFEATDEDFAEMNVKAKASYTYDNDEEMSMELSQKRTYALDGSASLVNTTFKTKSNDGQISGTIKGYEDEETVNFDIKFKNNGKFDEDYSNELDIENGKYRTERNSYFNSLSFLHNMVGASMFDQGDVLSMFNAMAIITLIEEEFKGLTLYEDDTYFSVKIKFNLKDVENASDDLQAALLAIAELQGNDVDEIEKLSVEMVFVFKDDKYHEAGIKMSATLEDMKTTMTVVVKFGVKEPKAGNYSRYEEIDSVSALFEE